VGACVVALDPIVQALKVHVLAAERIHTDDTTLPVLAKMKTVTGRIWTYVRDDRPLAVRIRQLPFLNIHAAGLANIRKSILLVLPGFCRQTRFQVMARSMKAAENRLRLLRPHVGVTEDGFFRSCKLNKAPIAIEAVRRIDELSKSSARSMAKRRNSGLLYGKSNQTPCHGPGSLAARTACQTLLKKRKQQKPSTIASHVGQRLPVFSMMGEFASVNNAAERAVRGVASAEKIGPSQGRMPEGTGPQLFLR